MKARILTGLIGGSAALLVLLFFPAWAISIVMALVSALGMYELLIVSGYLKHKGLLTAAMAFTLCAPFLLMGGSHFIAVCALVLYVLVLALIQITHHGRLRVEGTGFVFFVSVIVALALSCIAYMRALPHGIFYVFLAFIIAWLCDIGAYFTGTLFGKHKLCPKISPKKTVEGLVGGIVLSVLCSLLGAWIYEVAVLAPAGQHIVYWQVGLLALLLAPLSVIGDLFCSIIKRQSHVKDFGNVFPGHGGVMDRFDSLLFVAPILFIVCTRLPLVV
ncbi:MAG: phosphatidate cytidylyltransferase [Acutalibacteraceae bacterium]